MKKFVQRIFLISLLLLVSSACAQKSSPTLTTQDQKNLNQSEYNQRLQVGIKIINVKIASTPEEMRQGLSGSKKLADDEGMLFDFKTPQNVNFWMKNMTFDLDIIWIKNKKIVGISADVPHPTSSSSPLPFYSPPQPVDMVLEVVSGWSKKYGIEVGESINLKF